MTDQLPAPLVASEVDLSDFKFMPLDCVRLRDSDLASKVSGEEFRCAVLLWCAAWHQVPAASLPDDDIVLAQMAGFGRVVRDWKKVKTGSMRGWVLCSDGRLYHPVVAEKAIDAWRSKLEQRWRTELGRVKKHNQRHNMKLDVPDFEQWLSLGCPAGHALPVPEDSGGPSPRTPPSGPQGNGVQVKGRDREGKGREGIKEKTSNLPVAPARPSAEPLALVPSGKPQTTPDCPHLAILDLWAEVLPALPQHNPKRWRGAKADHLRVRWNETAKAEGWTGHAPGLSYFRKFFAYVGRSEFLTGRAHMPGRRPFVIELEWLVIPANWDKVHEGKYHPEQAA